MRRTPRCDISATQPWSEPDDDRRNALPAWAESGEEMPQGKDLIKLLAAEMNIPRRDLYNLIVALKNQS